MREIVVAIPKIYVDKNDETRARINGRSKTFFYRLELLNREGNNYKNVTDSLLKRTN